MTLTPLISARLDLRPSVFRACFKYIIADKVLSFDALLEVLILKSEKPRVRTSAEVLALKVKKRPPRLPQFVLACNINRT